MKRIVIIGGGISGLASAALLGRLGYEVTLLEKNSTFGGRARVLRSKGFAFDMGPSWYFMPEVFERFFGVFGKKPADFYHLIRLHPRYRVVFKYFSTTLGNDLKQNMKEFDRIEPGAGKKLQLYLQKCETLYNAAMDRLVYEDISNWRTLFVRKHIKDLSRILFTVPLWNSWYGLVKRYFQSEYLIKLLCFPAVFLGGSPFQIPAMFSLLNWADFGKGVWYPKGGMGKVVGALVTLARQYKVQLVIDAEVTAIEVFEGKVTGVRTKTAYYPADIVIGATDMAMLETNLLPKQYQSFDEHYWNGKTIGISALLLYLGVNKKIPGLVHHTLYFSEDWRKNFDHVFRSRTLPEDPSFYISARSVSDTTIAPKGCEELFVLVPLGARTDYKQEDLDNYVKKVLVGVEQVVGQPIGDNLVVKKVFTPKMFESEYNAYRGTALGLAHTLSQSAWLRPGNKSKRVQGLYYAGQYTNPGIGVPMALISAEITSTMIDRDANDSRQIFRKGSVTYYYSSLFFRGQVKQDVFDLYAYVRIIDDLVDNPNPLIATFDRLWQETIDAWQGKEVANRIVTTFVELAKCRGFEWSWIEAFWKAMKQDLYKKNYESFVELEEYMYGSADVIGLMMAKILGLSDEAMNAAKLQGKAMQYLNFIRDVEEDKNLGRNYLGYSKKQMSNKDLWSQFIKKHIEHYWEIQRQAEQGYVYIPKRYLVPIKTAADMYWWTARQIYNDPQIVWRKKIKPYKHQVLIQMLKNMFSLL